MKQIAFFALTLCLLFSCGTRREYKDALMRAETVMDEHPDSALLILDSLGQHESEFNRHFRMQYQQEIMQLKTEYANASYEYEENLRELQLLESAHQENESERKRLLDENVELQSRIQELQKEKAISRNLSASALFAEEPIVKRFHEIGVQPLANVKEEEWVELTDTFANSYPDLFLDLCQYCNTPQSIRVCMLTVMGLGNNEQANLLGTTSSRISNVKLALNKALFNESSSRTLNKNLLMQYSVY